MPAPIEGNGTTLSELNRTDDVCLRFEDEWRAGRRPRLEDYLVGVAIAEQGGLLEELLPLEWDYRAQAGDTFTQEEYVKRFLAWKEAVERGWGRREEPSGMTTVLPTEGILNGVPADTCPAVLVDLGYQQIKPLGKGGMGRVYKARKPRTDQLVALKLVNDDQASPEGVERFHREAKALARLSHPHIVRLYDFPELDGQPVLAMELVDGGTLEDRLGQQAVPPEEAARLVAILAWAVHAAHEEGVVHRDLKPANVLMAKEVAGDPGNVLGGYPKISDFGLAALNDNVGGKTRTGAVMGTPGYMSPEQAEGRTSEIGGPADVWALGVILYRCLTGMLPVPGGDVRPFREAKVPAELESICMSCLRQVPGERPTAEELAERLERSGKRWRRPLLIGAVGLAAVTVVVVSVVMMTRGKGPTLSRDGEVGIWSLNQEQQSVGDDKQAEAKPFQIRPLRVVQCRVADEVLHQEGVVGDLQRLPFDSLVLVEVEFSEPAYAYVIAFNPDGNEQLLYPFSERKAEAEKLPPDRVFKLDLPMGKPAKGKRMLFPLNDEPQGGLQVFAVAASRKPLRPYAEWKQARGVTGWQRIKDVEGVWAADLKGMYRVRAAGEVRGDPVAAPDGRPPLEKLLTTLRSGVEAVEVLAVPVRAKGEQP